LRPACATGASGVGGAANEQGGAEAQAMRLLIVQDETTQWFVRSLVCSIMDATKRPAEMRYVCDKHLGGPFASLDEVVAFVEGRR
jgi:hypothetical protein